MALALLAGALVAGCSKTTQGANGPPRATTTVASLGVPEQSGAPTTTVAGTPGGASGSTVPSTTSPEPRTTATGPAARPTGSGIDGRVRKGDGAPLAAAVEIRLDGSLAEAASAASGRDGHFLVPLSPGTYVLRAAPSGGASCPPVTVDVIVGVFAAADIACG